MTSDRKKPGVAFWATVVVVAAIAYPISFGPAVWLFARDCISAESVEFAYQPILWIYPRSGNRAIAAIHWYGHIGVPSGKAVTLRMPPIAGKRALACF